ncbi:hypothetical protein [Mucilaginibacter flavidus]|uniref:hypothetical protein n=1 Tax=Mucilaginibacter flavidus TaxID=2949309 RepID=UPI0020939561|nr:hypothetical protein [Mucilaginibacter flavidus]MCO5947881.1 hypothetical protein [Mucilaginibacter flavidus]
MSNIIPAITKSIFTYKQHKDIAEILSSPIVIQKLPIVGESKIFKSAAERYGHVIIKLSLETDENIISRGGGYYSYEWIPETTDVNGSDVIIPLNNSFEKHIIDEIKVFATLLEILNKNTTHLRFSVIGGSYRITEKTFFEVATIEAMIQIFKKMRQ